MKVLNDIDLNSMRSMIEAFPDLFDIMQVNSNVLEKIEKIKASGFQGIALLGMGGSAIAGDVCREILLNKTSTPLVSIRDFTLPDFVDSSWVVIAVSYSGNTEETISAYHESMKRNCQIFTITSGGQLEKLSGDDCLCRLPKGFQPRAAFPLLVALEVYLLEALLSITPSDMKSIRENLQTIANNWEESIATPSSTVDRLIDKVPLFIGWQHTVPVAFRAKCQINENSKSIAFFSSIPEMCHNEIESSGEYANNQIVPIFLRSSFETPEAMSKFEGLDQLFQDEGCTPLKLKVTAKSKLEEVLILTYYCDIVSLEIAERKKVDPVKVERIARLKRFFSEI